MTEPSTDPISKTAAAGQALGYSLQYDRVFYRLLTSPPGSIVSMEVFDDVGVERPDKTVLAEQDKSSLDGNPVSDRSVDLWKTLANWAEAVSSGQLSPEKTTFFLWIAKPCQGAFADRLRDAKSPEESKSTVQAILDELRGGDVTEDGFSEVGETVRNHIKRFARAFTDHCDLVSRMIHHFVYECGSGDHLKDIKEYFAKNQVVHSSIELDLIYHGDGWLRQKINAAIGDHQDARISRDELIEELKQYQQRVGAHHVLEAFDYSPSESETNQELQSRTYVQQLLYIDFSRDRLMQAIEDKLRASVTRSKWVEAQRVHTKGLKDFEASLKRRWDNVTERVRVSDAGLRDVDRGVLIYTDCADGHMRIENMDVPSGFVPGSYHEMADTEVVWWHPGYHDLKAKAAKRKDSLP
jgi:hypothetical protein